MAPWCSGYHYCTISFTKAWTQILRRLKSCSRHVGDSWWWGSLAMVPAGNKAMPLSSVNHTTKTIHHHHQENSGHKLYQMHFSNISKVYLVIPKILFILVLFPGVHALESSKFDKSKIGFGRMWNCMWVKT